MSETGTKTSEQTNGTVPFAVKTPFSEHALKARVPQTITVQEACDRVRNQTWTDAGSRELVDQIGREMAAEVYAILARRAQGDMIPVPHKTLVRDIAVPLEIKTPGGFQTIPAAAVEVQSYAPVGRHNGIT